MRSKAHQYVPSPLWALAKGDNTDSTIVAIVRGEADLEELGMVDTKLTLDAYTALLACLRRVASTIGGSANQHMIAALQGLHLKVPEDKELHDGFLGSLRMKMKHARKKYEKSKKPKDLYDTSFLDSNPLRYQPEDILVPPSVEQQLELEKENISAMGAKLAEKCTTIDALRAKNRTSESRIDALNTLRIREQHVVDAKLNTLQETLAKKDQTIVELADRLSALERELSARTSEVLLQNSEVKNIV